MCTKFYCVSDETAAGDGYVKEFRESMSDDSSERFGEIRIPERLLSGDSGRHDFTGFMREVLK
jgi:hypothetical protein